MNRGALACAGLMLLAGCAIAPRTPDVAGASAQPVEAPLLEHTPFFPQQIHQCGPAALATVLVASGVPADPEQLAGRVYVPGRQGSLQVELLAATRQLARVPYRVAPTLDSIAAELRAGRPVLVLQNLLLRSLPRWHYAVVIGIDDRGVTLRSGDRAQHRMSRRAFLRSWNYADNWGFVVLRPGEWPADAAPERWLATMAPLEDIGQLSAAAAGYQAALLEWPGDARFWLGLGNVRYAQHALPEARQAYLQAVAVQPEFAAAWNNLAQVLAEQGCRTAAAAALARARAGATRELLSTIDDTERALPAADAAACPVAP